MPGNREPSRSAVRGSVRRAMTRPLQRHATRRRQRATTRPRALPCSALFRWRYHCRADIGASHACEQPHATCMRRKASRELRCDDADVVRALGVKPTDRDRTYPIRNRGVRAGVPLSIVQIHGVNDDALSRRAAQASQNCGARYGLTIRPYARREEAARPAARRERAAPLQPRRRSSIDYVIRPKRRPLGLRRHRA